MDKYRVNQHPVTTESDMKKIEEVNTWVFIVDIKENKVSIREAVQAMYDVKCANVNTFVRPDDKRKEIDDWDNEIVQGTEETNNSLLYIALVILMLIASVTILMRQRLKFYVQEDKITESPIPTILGPDNTYTMMNQFCSAKKNILETFQHLSSSEEE